MRVGSGEDRGEEAEGGRTLAEPSFGSDSPPDVVMLITYCTAGEAGLGVSSAPTAAAVAVATSAAAPTTASSRTLNKDMASWRQRRLQVYRAEGEVPSKKKKERLQDTA